MSAVSSAVATPGSTTPTDDLWLACAEEPESPPPHVEDKALRSTTSATPNYLQQRHTLEEQLVESLKAAFPQVRPNYSRPLDGRVVEHRAADPGKPKRAVTDYELAGAVGGGIPAGPEFTDARIEYGKRFRQVWYWTAEDKHFRYNGAWAGCSHFGYQQQSECLACGYVIWTNCDRPAQPRCRKCRSTSGICPETGRACSTSWVKLGCRCDACRKWNTEAVRKHRARKKVGNNLLSPKDNAIRKQGNTPVGKEGRTLCTKRVITAPVDGQNARGKRITTFAPDLQTWTWLPAEVREHIGRHAASVQKHHAKREEARRKCFCKHCKQRGFLREELSNEWLCLNCDPNRRGLAAGSDEYWNDTKHLLSVVTE